MASPSRKRSHSDRKAQMPSFKFIDEQVYRTTVLHLSPSMTEDEVDEQLQQGARALGLLPPQITGDIKSMTSSLSATTIGSESNQQGSLLSQSTAPTSCGSSEHRPMTQSSVRSEHSVPSSQAPSLMSETQRKRSSGFRNGLRSKMAGFKKRRLSTSPTLNSIKSDSIYSPESDKASIKSGMKSPGSAESSKSSWSSPMSAAKSSYESAPAVDQEALKRSMECTEMLNLRKVQMGERARFVEFEQYLLGELRTQREGIKEGKARGHQGILDEHQTKIEKAVEELEARQLEDELKMQKEHEAEKRTAIMRLRHMEAYCQNPTPPPTPVDATSGRPSLDAVLPERKVTDRDYHNLAQQYRERDAMDTLHASKINVLRGKQKKAVENLMRKKERELETLEQEQQKELELVDNEYAGREENLRSALGAKRTRLELRWQTQALIERTKMERLTGLKHGPLPEVTMAVSSE